MSAAWLRVVLKIKKGKGDGYEKEMVRNSIGMCVSYRYFRRLRKSGRIRYVKRDGEGRGSEGRGS